MIRATMVGLAFVSLTACATERPRIVLPPPELATCADEAESPDLPPYPWAAALKALTGADAVAALKPIMQQRDRLMLDGYLALRSAYGDCRSKVDGLKAWRETAGK